MEPRCVVCGGGMRRRFEAVVPRFEVVACDDCGCGLTWPPLPVDELASWYPQSYYGTANVRFNPLFERLTEWFRRRRAEAIERRTHPGAVVDVGCGRGLTLRYLRDAGYRAIGIEVSDVAAHFARDVNGLEVRLGDFLSQQFDEPLEAIIFWHSLEHMPDPIAALDRARALLRPGGLLVVAVPNFDSVQSRATGKQWFHLDIPRHYIHFTARSLRRALRDRGFRIAGEAHFSLEQNPYGWIQSLLNRAFSHNLLYSMLKHESARMHRLREHPFGVIASAILAIPLLPISIGLMLFETMLRRGGTVEMYAIKES